jgi:DNA-directed RNA polymerase specialized sigma24 family protein
MTARRPDDARPLVELLYDCHGAGLYRYAAMILADATLAEDAVHQVFAALLRNGPPTLERELHNLRRAQPPALLAPTVPRTEPPRVRR